MLRTSIKTCGIHGYLPVADTPGQSLWILLSEPFHHLSLVGIRPGFPQPDLNILNGAYKDLVKLPLITCCGRKVGQGKDLGNTGGYSLVLSSIIKSFVQCFRTLSSRKSCPLIHKSCHEFHGIVMHVYRSYIMVPQDPYPP